MRLKPCGQAALRYLDANRRPLTGYSASPEIVVTPDEAESMADGGNLINPDRHNYWASKVQTDAAGRVTLPALIPGARYHVRRLDKDGWHEQKEFVAQQGKTIELGDVVVQSGK